MPSIYIRQGRERSLLHHHPWVFSGSVHHIEGLPAPGETVKVHAMDGAFLAWGAYSPTSQIRVRAWSFDPLAKINSEFLYDRIRSAIEFRSALFNDPSTDSFRLIHAESDGIPGLIVDKYVNFLVIQLLSTGVEFFKKEIISTLEEILHPAGIFERSDLAVRDLEGLPQQIGVLSGETPPDLIQIIENGLKFWVEIKHGQKTGFYLDQRINRQQFASIIRSGTCLNCFAYTGAFTAFALKAGVSSVLSIDASADSLELAKKNIQLNGFPLAACEWQVEDVFSALRGLRDSGRSFDTIILDPPKFAPTAAQVNKAARAYKDINMLAFKLLNPGGTLFTFSCSGGIDDSLFQKIVSDAALDAHVDARIIYHLAQGPDHPISLNFPEGSYLKGLVCKLA
jgi:23S rRNA (cytosine1962-C5)-methyltransferase